LEAVEAPHLEEDRLVARHAQAVADGRHLGGRQLAVLVGERVDGRVDHELWDGEALREGGEREDGRVVLEHVLAEEGPRPALRARDVEGGAPRARALLRARLAEPGGRRAVRTP